MAIENFIPTVWSESMLRALDTAYIGVANCNREFEGDILLINVETGEVKVVQGDEDT